MSKLSKCKMRKMYLTALVSYRSVAPVLKKFGWTSMHLFSWPSPLKIDVLYQVWTRLKMLLASICMAWDIHFSKRVWCDYNYALNLDFWNNIFVFSNDFSMIAKFSLELLARVIMSRDTQMVLVSVFCIISSYTYPLLY